MKRIKAAGVLGPDGAVRLADQHLQDQQHRALRLHEGDARGDRRCHVVTVISELISLSDSDCAKGRQGTNAVQGGDRP